jgi:hypothetical protein
MLTNIVFPQNHDELADYIESFREKDDWWIEDQSKTADMGAAGTINTAEVIEADSRIGEVGGGSIGTKAQRTIRADAQHREL